MNSTLIRITPTAKKELDRLMPYCCIELGKRSLTYAEFVDVLIDVYKVNKS